MCDFKLEDLEIYDVENRYIGMLNSQLVKQQKINAETISLLKITHQIRDIYIKAMEVASSRSALERYARELEKLEYLQQTLWGFEKNSDWHRWYAVPQCSCPYYKNEKLWGKPGKWVNVKCSVHGNRGKEDGVKYVNS